MGEPSRAVAQAQPWRDLALFALGPGVLACAVAAAFRLHPWPVPYAVQAKNYDPLVLGPMLALAGLGVWLSSRVGPPSAPAFSDRRTWLRLLGAAALVGLAFVALSVILDLGMGLSRIDAEAIGQRSINVPFPASIAHYAFGAVTNECIGHLIPIPILCWLIGVVALRGRHRLAVFWAVVALTSLLQPLGQAMPIAGRAPVLALIVAVTLYAGNFLLAGLFLRFGWPVLILTTLVLELGWHVAWPLAVGG